MKNVTMKKRFTAAILSFVMVFSLLAPYHASAEEAETFAGYVYLSVEKSTLGQGLVNEPVRVGVNDG